MFWKLFARQTNALTAALSSKAPQTLTGFSFGLVCLLVSLAGCNTNKTDAPGSSAPEPAAQIITYDIVIRNSNPDDVWTEECLSEFSSAQFINQIFDGLYGNQLKAFTYEENKPLSAEVIKTMEASGELDRRRIGKIQVTEKWNLNTDNYLFDKQVRKMVLGYELYDIDSSVRGYKALFVIQFP